MTFSVHENYLFAFCFVLGDSVCDIFVCIFLDSGLFWLCLRFDAFFLYHVDSYG